MYAVLTGDIVKSTLLSNDIRNEILNLNQGIMNDDKWKGINIEIEVYRGDGIQIITEAIEKALKVALLYRTMFRGNHYLKNSLGFDIRFAIGIGQIDFKKEVIGESYGEALVRSGRLLDTMKKTNSNLISIDLGNEKENLNFEVMFGLLEMIISKWTRLQSDIIHFKLLGITENEIAEKLNLKQPTVNRSAKSAGWWAVERLLNYFEKNIKQQIQ